MRERLRNGAWSAVLAGGVLLVSYTTHEDFQWWQAVLGGLCLGVYTSAVLPRR